jgi:hypothetical protein
MDFARGIQASMLEALRVQKHSHMYAESLDAAKCIRNFTLEGLMLLNAFAHLCCKD